MFANIQSLMSSDSQVVENALEELVKVEFQNQPEKAKIRNKAICGGIFLAVITAMRQHNQLCKIQHDGLMLLSCLLGHKNKGVTAIYNLGGIKTVVSAMKAFPDDEMIQDMGLLVLDIELCLKAAVEQFVALDGIQTIVTALQKHRESSHVQLGACNALFRLAVASQEDDNLGICLKLKQEAFANVTQAIQFHPNDRDLARGVKKFINQVI